MGSLEGPRWQLDENPLDSHHDPLDPEGYDVCLDPGMTNVAAASELLKPYDARLMRCYPVSSRINHVANDDEACSAPVELSEIQDRLFL
jgi:putative SOS response-associated peptidase YedK